MKLLPPPGPERRAQIVRLAVLLVLLAIILWIWAPAGTPRPSSNQPAREVGAAAGERLPVPDAVKLDSLEGVSELGEADRNPFVFGERVQPSQPGSAFLTTPQPTLPPVPLAPPVPEGPPPIQLRLTGMTVTSAGARTLVTLKDPATNALYQAYEGDIVDGRYRVVRVGVQSVVVSYLDGSGLRTLPLGG